MSHKKSRHHEFKANNWVQIGVVGKPYGLRGAFYISGREEPLFEDCTTVIIDDKATPKSVLYKIRIHKIHKGRSTLQLENHEDRTSIESLVGTPIWANVEEIVVEDDEEYLWDDVIGRKVLSLKREEVGEIIDMANYGASDIVEIRNIRGAVIELPFNEFYFDMSFQFGEHEVSLIVDEETFEDLWSDRL